MPTNIEITELPEKSSRGHALINIIVSGAITEERYKFIEEGIKKLISKHGTVRIMLILDDMEGLTPKAMMDDLKLEVEKMEEIDRVAIASDHPNAGKQEQMNIPLTDVRTRFFPKEQASEAYAWLKEE